MGLTPSSKDLGSEPRWALEVKKKSLNPFPLTPTTALLNRAPFASNSGSDIRLFYNSYIVSKDDRAAHKFKKKKEKKKSPYRKKQKLLMPQWNIRLKVTNLPNLKVILSLPKTQAFFFLFYSFVYSSSLFFFFSIFSPPQYKRHKNGLGVHCLLQYLCQFVRGVWWLWQNKYLTSYPCYCYASSTLFSYSALAINVLNSWLCCVSSWADV